MLKSFRRDDPAARAASRLHEAAVLRAREPVFYARFAVPDSIDGRFDLLTLHVFLLLDALKAAPKTAATGTRLATLTFAGFDEALRELGVSDMGMSRRIKAMANAFYGRVEAYAAAMASEEVLATAVLRNLYRGDAARADDSRHLAAYMKNARGQLGNAADIAAGIADFGPLPS